MACALLDLVPHVVVDFHIEDVCDEIESILIVLNLGVQTSEIEAIRQVVFVDLTEVFIAAGRYELAIC